MIHDLGHALSRRSDIAYGEVWKEGIVYGKRKYRGKNVC